MPDYAFSKALDQVLSQSINEGQLPGVAAAVATNQGIVYQGAFGKSDLIAGSDMTVDTSCYIASMIKPVISVAAMQLVERGIFDLDTPAAEWVPELSKPQVLDRFTVEGEPLLRPAQRSITLRHLLTHTSGLSYDFWSDPVTRFMAHGDLTTAPDLLLHEPGDRWTYGTSMAWVGKMIEHATGQPLGDFMAENVLTPLGISSISAQPPLTLQDRVARVYQRGVDGAVGDVPPDIESRLGLERTAWYGNTLDFLTFAQMLMHGGKFGQAEVLKFATVCSMFQNQIGDLDVAELKTVKPAYTHDVDFYPGMLQKWGYGFLINTARTPEGRSAGSIGWVGIANTFFWIDLERRVAGVLMAQILPLFDPVAIQLYRTFERVVNRSL